MGAGSTSFDGRVLTGVKVLFIDAYVERFRGVILNYRRRLVMVLGIWDKL